MEIQEKISILTRGIGSKENRKYGYSKKLEMLQEINEAIQAKTYKATKDELNRLASVAYHMKDVQFDIPKSVALSIYASPLIPAIIGIVIVTVPGPTFYRLFFLIGCLTAAFFIYKKMINTVNNNNKIKQQMAAELYEKFATYTAKSENKHPAEEFLKGTAKERKLQSMNMPGYISIPSIESKRKKPDKGL